MVDFEIGKPVEHPARIAGRKILVNHQYEQEVRSPVVNIPRNDHDTPRRGKSPRVSLVRGTFLHSIPSEMAPVLHGARLQLEGLGITGDECDPHADELTCELSPDLSGGYEPEAESTAPGSDSSPASMGEAWRRVLRFLADGDARQDAVYERARNRLLQFFAARGKLGDEELADATFDRVVAKLSDEVAAQVRSPVGYMLRFAHFIYLEHIKSEIAHRSRLATLQPDDADCMESAQEAWLRNERLSLLERCLDELPADERTLLLAYYTHDGRSRIVSRQKLSKELGITPALLRTRVSRLLGTLNQRVRALAEAAELA